MTVANGVVTLGGAVPVLADADAVQEVASR